MFGEGRGGERLLERDACLIFYKIGTLRSDNGDGDGNVRSLGRAGPRRVGVPAKIEITNFTSENVDDGH